MIRGDRLVLLAGVVALVAVCPGFQGNRASFAWESGDSSVSLLNAGKPVWQFQYDKSLPKPMFHPLSLTDGTTLTWDQPPDHPWHHALWFAWKYLNGVNYWEEGKGSPETRGITEWSNVSVRRGQDFSASIRMDLAYHPPGHSPVLKEAREIRISAPLQGEYRMDWTMIFTAQEQDVDLNRAPISGEPDGKPSGGYAGLSVRFARDFREWRAETTRRPVPADLTVPFHCETGAVGLDFNGRIAGREAGLALLDDASNLNSPTPWYTVMDGQKDFGFAQAALIYYRPHTLPARQSLTLRYRVVVHEGRWSASDLRAAQQKYSREVDGKK
jgi:hypothetical protein